MGMYMPKNHELFLPGLPFDQMEPSRSMQHRSGNPVRIPNWNGIFPNSELSFTRGFMNELMTD